MPSIPLKNSSTALTQETRTHVRDAMRTTIVASSDHFQQHPEVKFGPKLEELAIVNGTGKKTDSVNVVCCEEIDGRRWSYVVDNMEVSSRKMSKKGNLVRAVSMHTPRTPTDEMMTFIRSYVVPEGFPDSVTPSYVPYMTWRALKHFFGGAMGVFTTQALLSSVGVSNHKTMQGAVAINWILKDGAGRVGKMLFARQGKKFDYDLKQLRFTGDLLMELGAGIELATTAMPHLFLPLACLANVAKNVGAVTSTSTRTPIYKAYARGENIGDVTAKGECVGNIADLLGTGLSILLSKRNPSLVTSFAVLSCGYLFSSYQEVKSVVLHTLNRARFTVAVESFLQTGNVPSLNEGNSKESIFNPPWAKKPVVLGSRFGDAFQEPSSFLAIEPLFEKEKYIVTYNPSKGNVHMLLKDKAKSEDILKASFHAYVLMHFIRTTHANKSSKNHVASNSLEMIDSSLNQTMLTNGDYLDHISESCKIVSTSFGVFKQKASDQGWIMAESLLNPGRARLCELKEL